MHEAPQVIRAHYFTRKYLNKERWLSYWYQIEVLRAIKGTTVLEIGMGNGIVRDTLEKLGYQVTTLDIDATLDPDIIASATEIPCAKESFDVVLAAEILEHLPLSESVRALSEIFRVTRSDAVITLPHAGYTFAVIWKFPLMAWRFWIMKIPQFFKTHQFNGEHYWEMGKREYPVIRVRRALHEVGFRVQREGRHPDDPAHYFFHCTKREPC